MNKANNFKYLNVSDAIPRLGIKKFNWWSEALHGLANNGNVTVFPEPVGMAASFDDQLVYRVFNATSQKNGVLRIRLNPSRLMASNILFFTNPMALLTNG